MNKKKKVPVKNTSYFGRKRKLTTGKKEKKLRGRKEMEVQEKGQKK